uniref:SFRICE_022413 n=1 Tax=Spodoptera frugiperda TaxID=7108 RepID=A0A2H1W2X3_SPOFR
MFQSKVIILSSAILVLCSAAAIFEKFNKKCDFTDDECLKSLYFGIIEEATDNGIPELGVPKLDPYVLKNERVSVLGMINITVIDGTVNGFKKCALNKFHNDIESLHVQASLTCENFIVEGKYKIEVTPVLKALIGTLDIHGEGQGKVGIDKVKLDVDVAYEVIKNDNGDIRFKLKPEDNTYTFEFLEKVTFAADNVFIGSQDISTVTTNILNENWEFIAKNLGKPVIDLAMTVFTSNGQKVLDVLPIKDLYNTDLSPYIKS